MIWCYSLLALAICCVWIPGLSLGRYRLHIWLLPFLAATLAGLVLGILAWTAVSALAALTGIAWASRRATSLTARRALTVLAALVALALALHLAPGFQNPKLLASVQVSPSSAPLTQYLNFDKAAAGLILLAFYVPRISTIADLKRILGTTVLVAATTAIMVVGMAWAIGYVRADIKFPPYAFAFLATNLFFTCIPEEAFFRGLLQESLMSKCPAWPSYWRWMPVLVSTILFGLAHAAGDKTFVALATLAGLGYSIAYALTRRIESAVLAHFAVNMLQFIGFSYPFLLR